MENNPNWLEKLKEKREYLRQWLAQFQAASRAAAEVQKNLDFTDLQIRAVESRPDESSEIPLPNLGGTVDHDFSYLRTAYPWLPDFNEPNLSTASSFSSTGTVQISMYLGRVGDINSYITKEYSEEYLSEFEDLQNRYDRPTELRLLLKRLSSKGSLERLENAIRSFDSYRSGTGSRTSAAADMRTLLDGVKGDLFELARLHPGENITWEIMASRLAIGGVTSPQYAELLDLEKVRSSLISRLSDIFKDREAGSVTNMDQIWLEFQEHLVAVLGLIPLSA